MKQWATQKRSGFTIVELLIVIVVIAILAAITVVAYNGIRERAETSSLHSAAAQAYKKIEAEKIRTGVYPSAVEDAGVIAAAGSTYDYRAFGYGSCVAVSKGDLTYHVSTDNPSPTSGSCGQVKAEYFNNNSLSGTPVLTRYEDQINNTWGTGSPQAGVVNVDSFSSRYTTYINPPVTGAYTFYTVMDDAERLTVNGTVLVDAITTSSPCCVTRTMPVVNLTANTPVPVVVEHREGGGGAYIRLLWSYTGQTQTAVPASAFLRKG